MGGPLTCALVVAKVSVRTDPAVGVPTSPTGTLNTMVPFAPGLNVPVMSGFPLDASASLPSSGPAVNVIPDGSKLPLAWASYFCPLYIQCTAQ